MRACAFHLFIFASGALAGGAALQGRQVLQDHDFPPAVEAAIPLGHSLSPPCMCTPNRPGSAAVVFWLLPALEDAFGVMVVVTGTQSGSPVFVASSIGVLCAACGAVERSIDAAKVLARQVRGQPR